MTRFIRLGGGFSRREKSRKDNRHGVNAQARASGNQTVRIEPFDHDGGKARRTRARSSAAEQDAATKHHTVQLVRARGVEERHWIVRARRPMGNPARETNLAHADPGLRQRAAPTAEAVI
uniref:hypothetical protein n=1 Tax=Streptomyces sp. SAT1 TaxID=1849967 RepID=UPI00144A8780|nr:hypothetical protein [Streptomyces sp. SAT1]